MGLNQYFAQYFGIVELEEPFEDVISMKGVRRMVQWGFALGFIISNVLSGLLFGWASHGFLLPTGLSVNRLMLITVLLFYFYNSFDIERMRDLDKKYGWNYIYVPEKHEEHVTKKW